jgi:ferrous iron transport protein A
MTDHTLADLPIGSGGTVRSISGSRAVSRRLMEMGMLPGTFVEVVRIAPMGDPIVLRLRNYQLSIRKAEAIDILIDPATVREMVANQIAMGAVGSSEPNSEAVRIRKEL